MASRLQTARTVARDLISTYPATQGSLEFDLCNILGINPNTNVTASALSLDNSGRVAKDQLLSKHGTETPPLGTSKGFGIGLSVENATNTDCVALTQDTFLGSQSFNVRPRSGVTGDTSFPIFAVNMASGALSGYVTQDLASTPLIPATGGASAGNFYNGTGHFSVPGVSPSFDGVTLWAIPTAITGGATTNQKWSLTSPSGAQSGIDVTGHFNAISDNTKVTIPLTGGKFAIVCHLAVNTGSDPQDVSLTIQKNGSVDIYSQTYTNVVGFFQYLTITTVVALSATDYIRVRVGSGVADDMTSGYDPGAIAAYPQNFSGRLFLYRVE